MDIELVIKIALYISIACAIVLFGYFIKEYIGFSQLLSATMGFFLSIFNGIVGLFGKIEEIREERRAEKLRGISPEGAIALRNEYKGFTGIYIIYNATKDMYYVGQGQNVYQRCGNHFLGKGNADIYADYKYGDDFYIEYVSLVDSGYDNLDDLERYYIDYYDAIRHGYNKKKGNR